uniref:Uncharacterized protein n=1 Tax=Romanomermis culicivorax TaxID=13658 RepID=A0A915KEH8_ROMCU
MGILSVILFKAKSSFCLSVWRGKDLSNAAGLWSVKSWPEAAKAMLTSLFEWEMVIDSRGFQFMAAVAGKKRFWVAPVTSQLCGGPQKGCNHGGDLENGLGCNGSQIGGMQAEAIAASWHPEWPGSSG